MRIITEKTITKFALPKVSILIPYPNSFHFFLSLNGGECSKIPPETNRGDLRV